MKKTDFPPFLSNYFLVSMSRFGFNTIVACYPMLSRCVRLLCQIQVHVFFLPLSTSMRSVFLTPIFFLCLSFFRYANFNASCWTLYFIYYHLYYFSIRSIIIIVVLILLYFSLETISFSSDFHCSVLSPCTASCLSQLVWMPMQKAAYMTAMNFR